VGKKLILLASEVAIEINLLNSTSIAVPCLLFKVEHESSSFHAVGSHNLTSNMLMLTCVILCPTIIIIIDDLGFHFIVKTAKNPYRPYCFVLRLCVAFCRKPRDTCGKKSAFVRLLP
jgi:hypothetical protein